MRFVVVAMRKRKTADWPNKLHGHEKKTDRPIIIVLGSSS
jgi:hypothetical protein